MTSPWPSPAVMESLAAVTSCRRGEVVYARGDPVEHLYRIVFGLARKYSVMPDGRRQIVDFLLPGDFFGFNARQQHQLTVEAVVDGTVSHPLTDLKRSGAITLTARQRVTIAHRSTPGKDNGSED